MSVIRMIKLFGWEPKVTDQLAKKREDELKYIRKYKILELVNGNVKYESLITSQLLIVTILTARPATLSLL